MPIHPGANGPAGPISLLPLAHLLPITTKSEKRQSHKSPPIIVRCVAGPTDFRSRFERFLSQVPTRCVASPHFGPDVPRKSASQRVQRCRWPIFADPRHICLGPATLFPLTCDTVHCYLRRQEPAGYRTFFTASSIRAPLSPCARMFPSGSNRMM